MRSVLSLFLIAFAINLFCNARPHHRKAYNCYDEIQANSAENIALIRSGRFRQSIEELCGQYEGDMVLSTEQRQMLVGLGSRNGIRNESYRWPNKELVYEISTEDFDQEQIDYIECCIDTIIDVSCVSFRRRTGDDINYVRVTGMQDGCYSNVGYRGRGVQVLNLSNATRPGAGCLRNGTIMHEFLHALGFFHQQSASERDTFVDIMWDHIQSDSINNFVKYSVNAVTNFNTLYDYGSVMHYSAYAFSKDGQATIVPADPTAVLGQRTHLSFTDIEKLNLMYNCM